MSTTTPLHVLYCPRTKPSDEAPSFPYVLPILSFAISSEWLDADLGPTDETDPFPSLRNLAYIVKSEVITKLSCFLRLWRVLN